MLFKNKLFDEPVVAFNVKDATGNIVGNTLMSPTDSLSVRVTLPAVPTVRLLAEIAPFSELILPVSLVRVRLVQPMEPTFPSVIAPPLLVFSEIVVALRESLMVIAPPAL